MSFRVAPLLQSSISQLDDASYTKYKWLRVLSVSALTRTTSEDQIVSIIEINLNFSFCYRNTLVQTRLKYSTTMTPYPLRSVEASVTRAHRRAGPPLLGQVTVPPASVLPLSLLPPRPLPQRPVALPLVYCLRPRPLSLGVPLCPGPGRCCCLNAHRPEVRCLRLPKRL